MEKVTQEDAEWINAQLNEVVEDTGDFEFKMWLSTDGKHSIEVSGKRSEYKGAAKFAQQVFDKLMLRYGSKQATAAKEYNKAAASQTAPTAPPPSQGQYPPKGKCECPVPNIVPFQAKSGKWFKKCTICSNLVFGK